MKNNLLILLSCFILFSCTDRNTKTACVGASIIEGVAVKDETLHSFPALLDSILGDKTSVLNCAKSGTTIQKVSDFSYWNTKEFSNLFTFNPDIVLIGHGSNDTKPHNWNALQFEKDYQALIDTIKLMPSKPIIIISTPVPVFKTMWGINDSTLLNGVIPILKKLAVKNNIQLIDLYTPFENKTDWFPDFIHPNENGTREMARIVAREINNLF